MGLFDWLKGKKNAAKQGSAADPAPKAADPMPEQLDPDDPVYQATFDARDAYWSRIGAMDPDVLGHMISPELLGAPPWPTTRQAFRIVRTPGTLIISSDGLGDPSRFVEVPGQGYEMEIYGEFPGAQDMTQGDIMGAPEFQLVRGAATVIAGHGQFAAALDHYGVLSTEIEAPPAVEERWHTENGTVGVLIGVPVTDRAARFTGPAGEVRMAALTVLTPEETSEVVKGPDARTAVMDALVAAGVGHATDFKRASVV